MKKILLTLIALFFLRGGLLFSQNIDFEELNINFIQLPLVPIDKATRNYQVVIEQKDATKNAEMKANYEAQKAILEQDYKDKLAIYEEDKKRDAAKSVGKTITDNLFRSKEEAPTKPVRSFIAPPVYLILPDNSGIEGKVNLNGYTKSSQNAVNVTLTFLGTEFTTPTYKTQTYTDKVTWTYSSAYKNPVHIKIEYNGKIYMDEVLASTNVFTSFNSDEKSASEYDAQRLFDNSKNSYIQKSVNADVDKVNEYINSKFGYSPAKHEALLFMVKSKKVDYSDYAAAYALMNEGFLMLNEDLLQEDGRKKVSTAIDNFNEIMKQYDPNDKKARINEDVAIATYYNYLECYIWQNDFLNAQKCILKLKTSNTSNREERRMERIKVFMADQKLRFEANK